MRNWWSVTKNHIYTYSTVHTKSYMYKHTHIYTAVYHNTLQSAVLLCSLSKLVNFCLIGIFKFKNDFIIWCQTWPGNTQGVRCSQFAIGQSILFLDLRTSRVFFQLNFIFWSRNCKPCIFHVFWKPSFKHDINSSIY